MTELTDADREAITRAMHSIEVDKYPGDTHSDNDSRLAEAAYLAGIAEERERCAKICDELGWSHIGAKLLGPEPNCIKCRNAIRAQEKP